MTSADQSQQWPGAGGRWGASGVRAATSGARVYVDQRLRNTNPLQRVLGVIFLLILLGVGLVLGVVFLAIGAVAALGIAAFILIRRALNALTGNSRDTLNKARGRDNDGRRNVTVVRR